MFQLSCPNWNSSLNRAELETHLLRGSGKIFQSQAAAPTRAFIHAVLAGKGIEARCVLNTQQMNAAAAAPPPSGILALTGAPMLGLTTVPTIDAVAVAQAAAASAAAGAGQTSTSSPLSTTDYALQNASQSPPATAQSGGQPEVDVPLPPETEAQLHAAMEAAVPFEFHPAPQSYPPDSPHSVAELPVALLPDSTLAGFAAISTLATPADASAAAAPNATRRSSTSQSTGTSDEDGESKSRQRALDTKQRAPVIPDKLLACLQFETVPTERLPASIVIPKPCLDEGALLMRALNPSKSSRERQRKKDDSSSVSASASPTSTGDASQVAAMSMVAAASSPVVSLPETPHAQGAGNGVSMGFATQPLTLQPSMQPLQPPNGHPLAMQLQAPPPLNEPPSLLQPQPAFKDMFPPPSSDKPVGFSGPNGAGLPFAAPSLPFPPPPPPQAPLVVSPYPVMDPSSVSPISRYPAFDSVGARPTEPDAAQSRALLRLLQTEHRSRRDLQPIYLTAIRRSHARQNPAAPPLSEIEELSQLANIEHAQLCALVEQTQLTPDQQAAWHAAHDERQHITDRWARLGVERR